MIAFKFLAAGGVGPFTEREWPIPAPGTVGEWVVAPRGELARYGVHACRPEDLSYWPHDELWIVELGGTILRAPHQLVASRGRMLERVAGWNEQGAREYAVACAWRARDLAAEALELAGLAREAASLRTCNDLVSLQSTASAVVGDAGRDQPRGLAAYAAGAALRARQGRYPEASLQAAHLGAALLGREQGADAERAWQSAWLARRLDLAGAVARSSAAASPT
jgi:hypothetical protein